VTPKLSKCAQFTSCILSWSSGAEAQIRLRASPGHATAEVRQIPSQPDANERTKDHHRQHTAYADRPSQHLELAPSPVASRGSGMSQTGSSDLSMGWSTSVGPSAVGGEHDSESVVIKIFEAVGQSADLLDEQVDGFGSAVGDT
jgi:hypothetical protein